MGEMEENRSYVLVLKTCEMEVTPFRHPVWATTRLHWACIILAHKLASHPDDLDQTLVLP